MKSQFAMVVGALVGGLVFALLMGTAAKVEAEVGSIIAHLPMFIIGTGAAWFVLSISRNRLMARGSNG